MAIVCGIDAGERAGCAVAVAGLLARKMKLPLHLVHDAYALPRVAPESARAIAQRSSEQLQGDVHLHLMAGPLGEDLAHIAAREEATLVVVSVPDQTTRAWCADVVDLILRAVRVPVLFVRETEAFEGWAMGVRPLCVVLDADFSVASRRASKWVEKLAKLGPCELVAVHQYETLRAQTSGQPAASQGLVSETTVRASVERELNACFKTLDGDLQLRTRLLPRRGVTSESQLAACTIDEAADLVVVGHDVGKRGELELAPVLQQLLLFTDCSLLCVPSQAGAL